MTLSRYSTLIEDRNENRVEQDRTAGLVEALAVALPEIRSMNTLESDAKGLLIKTLHTLEADAKGLLCRKVGHLVALCAEEDELLRQLQELRDKGEFS